MDNFNDSQLLMCEKEDLIKYINDLKTDIHDMEVDRDSMLETCGDLDNMEECVGYVNDLKERVKELDAENEILTAELPSAIPRIADLFKQIKELKERILFLESEECDDAKYL